MGKLNTLPDGVKKSQVVLTTYDEETDTTKLVTRDGKHWSSKYGSAWAETEPEEGGQTPKYDPAQEEQNDPEEDRWEDETTPDDREGEEGEEEEPSETPEEKQAREKKEAAENKVANKRTVAAQKKAASEGDPNAGKQNELLNRQARLAGEKITDQHPVDGGPGGGGAQRTLTEREIEILEGSEANKAARQEKIAGMPGIDNTLPEEPLPGKPPEPPLGGSREGELDEEVATLRAEVTKLKGKLRAQDAMIAKMQVHLRGKFEGVDVEPDERPHLAPSPMAGVYPHNTDEIPTVDEINARNGQPERSPRPAVRGSKQRDERGYPIVPPEQKTEL